MLHNVHPLICLFFLYNGTLQRSCILDVMFYSLLTFGWISWLRSFFWGAVFLLYYIIIGVMCHVIMAL